MNHNIILQNKIKELEQKIESLKIEKEKIHIEKTVMENDNAMVTMYSRIKENNLLEENKLKLLLNNNKEKDSLKKQVETLTIQIDLLKKEINEKTGLYRKLPETLKENLVNKEQLGQLKKEIKKKANMKVMNEIESLRKNHELELINVKNQYEEMIKQKNSLISQYEGEKINNLFNSDRKVKEIIAELYNLNDLIEKIIKQYKKRFDMRKYSINTITPGMFLKIKEEYDKDIGEISMNINKYNFPYLFDAIKEYKLSVKDEVNSSLIKMKKEIKYSHVYNSSLLRNKEKGLSEMKSSMPLITK
jgi:vacuolar-type H+-ATPase subunit I/STV1